MVYLLTYFNNPFNMLLSVLIFIFTTFFSSCTSASGDLPEIKPSPITKLDDKVLETSGLIYFDSAFWTINDSGNPNLLYKIDPQTGVVLTEIKIANAENIDWEELTQDANYFYIADIGDNLRKRDEKQIYRIKKSDILKLKSGGSLDADVIRFEFPETDGKKVRLNAEAMVFYNGALHIFTKDFFETVHYSLPAQPGKAKVTYIEKYKSNGQVTGAAINEANDKIILVGYLGMGDRLFWELKNFSGNEFFNSTTRTFSLGRVDETSQLEAVCYGPKQEIFLSNENTWNVKQQLWSLSYPTE
ncbi:MAG: hypothetical protein ABI390_08100 [Daejeonella sp.]